MKGGTLAKVELWSRSSGDDEALLKMELWPQTSGGDEALVKMELWSRSSGDDEALVAGFARQGGGFDDLCSVVTSSGEKTRSQKGGPQFPAAALER